jgi:beta-lactamase class A
LTYLTPAGLQNETLQVSRSARASISASRRSFLTAITGWLAIEWAHAESTTPKTSLEAVRKIEQEIGGHIGLAVLNTDNGRRLSYRADERFAMCSTFKLMLAAAVLARLDNGSLVLSQPISFTRSQLLPHSRLADSHPNGGTVPLVIMLQSVIESSDNTAANCQLALIGGPPAYTAYLRGIGDPTTRLDRVELELNSNEPGDERDTTTPSAMLWDMHRVLLGNKLSSDSRALLLRWMHDCQTGRDRLRARLPSGWEAGDKTGTGARGAVNDLAILYPPKRHPILVACYLSGSPASMEVLNDAHARIGVHITSTVT